MVDRDLAKLFYRFLDLLHVNEKSAKQLMARGSSPPLLPDMIPRLVESWSSLSVNERAEIFYGAILYRYGTLCTIYFVESRFCNQPYSEDSLRALPKVVEAVAEGFSGGQPPMSEIDELRSTVRKLPLNSKRDVAELLAASVLMRLIVVWPQIDEQQREDAIKKSMRASASDDVARWLPLLDETEDESDRAELEEETEQSFSNEPHETGSWSDLPNTFPLLNDEGQPAGAIRLEPDGKTTLLMVKGKTDLSMALLMAPLAHIGQLQAAGREVVADWTGLDIDSKDIPKIVITAIFHYVKEEANDIELSGSVAQLAAAIRQSPLPELPRPLTDDVRKIIRDKLAFLNRVSDPNNGAELNERPTQSTPPKPLSDGVRKLIEDRARIMELSAKFWSDPKNRAQFEALRKPGCLVTILMILSVLLLCVTTGCYCFQ